MDNNEHLAIPIVERATSPASTLDSKTTIFNAIEYLLVNDCDHAFVQHNGEMAGLISVDQLLGLHRAKNLSGATVKEYMEPLLTIEGSEPQIRAAEIMSLHETDCIAVTNSNGAFVGIAGIDKLGSTYLER